MNKKPLYQYANVTQPCEHMSFIGHDAIGPYATCVACEAVFSPLWWDIEDDMRAAINAALDQIGA